MIEWNQSAPGVALITVTGRLDAHGAPRLRHGLDEARTAGLVHQRVRMDGVEFMDSAGLAAIVAGLKAARQNGGDLVLVDPSPMVRKVLELTLLDRVVPIEGGSDVERSG